MHWEWWDWAIWYIGLASFWIGGRRAGSRRERMRCFGLAFDSHRRAESQTSLALIFAIDDGASELPGEGERKR